MDNCIICGVPAEGNICPTHSEDVFFEFTGNNSNQVTVGHYYQGVVDGKTEFGIFVKLNSRVTGLLHKNELKQRIESLDWNIGDIVYVKVKSKQSDGKIDLGWSIRENSSDFRGSLVEGSDGVKPKLDTPKIDIEEKISNTISDERHTQPSLSVPIALLNKELGRFAMIEGKIIDIRQTTGPTLFELQDESGRVMISAFETAGKRTYPEIDVGDIVRVKGEVELRRGDVQVESKVISKLDGNESEKIIDKISSALYERAKTDGTDPIIKGLIDPDSLETASLEIRAAVFESRPVVIRHPATVDGYIAGASLEHAIIDLIERECEGVQIAYRYVNRRPYLANNYDMGAAISDTTWMLESKERYNDPIPLYVIISRIEDIESCEEMRLLGIYGAKIILIGGDGNGNVREYNCPDVIIETKDKNHSNFTDLSAEVAVLVNPESKQEILPLPAISYWKNPPAKYIEMASELGYDDDKMSKIRESIALEAFYQRHNGKREMILGILFVGNEQLIEQSSSYFRKKVESEIQTVSYHIEQLIINGRKIGMLDIEKFTHRYQFPPIKLLMSEIIEREEIEVLIGNDTTNIYVESNGLVDRESLENDINSSVIEKRGVGGRKIEFGKIAFVPGDRDEMVEIVIESISKQLQ